jgi:lipopolysaccharide/colanic/teichoic acid biosynthesis glycosyltransferase
MKVYIPTSTESISRIVCSIDVVNVALAAPLAALLRDPTLFESARITSTLQYFGVSLIAGVLMLVIFHPGKNIADQLSWYEVKSVLSTAVWTTATAFSIYFFLFAGNDIPRSLPFIQMLVLNSLMLLRRVLAGAGSRPEVIMPKDYNSGSQHILLIGVNKITFSYLKTLETFEGNLSSIVGILDDNRRMIGRALRGVPIVEQIEALPRMVREYKVHGVEIDRVLVAAVSPEKRAQGDPGPVWWTEVESFCRDSRIPVEYLGDILGLSLEQEEARHATRSSRKVTARRQPQLNWKRLMDIAGALALAALLSPVIGLTALAVMLTLGWPPIFWQKRVGCEGRPFLIYKFRTFHAPYDRQGRYVEEESRSSRLGAFLRRTRLDELPQLWNVLCGDMSLVGPRPLLPVDQPTGDATRLHMRPGLTGWAQIKGGRTISPDEKGVLDGWYVSNVSFWLDLSILARTVTIALAGDRRSQADAALVKTKSESMRGLPAEASHRAEGVVAKSSLASAEPARRGAERLSGFEVLTGGSPQAS